MIGSPRRLGFGLSLLAHLGLLAGLWLWQQQARDTALEGEVVPVQLAMFAAAPPAPVPVPAPATTPTPAEMPVEETVEQPVEPPPDTAPEPLETETAPELIKPVTVPRPRPVEQPQPPARPPPQTARSQTVAEPPAETVQPEPVPAAAVPAAAPRTAQRVQLREAYKAALLAAIERHKFYPKRARRRRMEGRVRVGFRIAADGRLEDIRLVSGSGAALLDRAALETLRRLARAAPLPPELGLSEWALVVPIDFQLR